MEESIELLSSARSGGGELGLFHQGLEQASAQRSDERHANRALLSPVPILRPFVPTTFAALLIEREPHNMQAQSLNQLIEKGVARGTSFAHLFFRILQLSNFFLCSPHRHPRTRSQRAI